MRRTKFYKIKKIHPVRHTYLTFITKVKLCKKAEKNSEPSHLCCGIFNMTCHDPATSVLTSSSFYPGHWSKRFWISGDLQNTIYLQIALITSGTIRSLKLKTKTEFSFSGTTNTNIKRK